MTHFGSKTTSHYEQLTWRDEKLCSHFATLLRKIKAIEATTRLMQQPD